MRSVLVNTKDVIGTVSVQNTLDACMYGFSREKKSGVMLCVKEKSEISSNLNYSMSHFY